MNKEREISHFQEYQTKNIGTKIF